MKRFAIFFAGLVLLVAFSAHAQLATCTTNGPNGYSGPDQGQIRFDCGAPVTPPTCTPPQVLKGGACVTPTPATSCSASQTSSTFTNGNVLTRQCVGTVGWGQYNTPDTNVALTSLDTELRGTFGNYRYSGLTMVPVVTTGQYISLAFTPTAVATLQFNANPTYGIAGTISVSTTPGNFAPATSTCIATNGNSLNMLAGANHNGWCNLTLGTTYYVNFANVNTSGSVACKAPATSCTSASLAYYTQ